MITCMNPAPRRPGQIQTLPPTFATIRIMTHSSALTCELMLLKLRNASFIVIARALLISTEARSSVKCRKSEAKEGWTCDWTKDARYPTTRLNGDGYCSCERRLSKISSNHVLWAGEYGNSNRKASLHSCDKCVPQKREESFEDVVDRVWRDEAAPATSSTSAGGRPPRCNNFACARHLGTFLSLSVTGPPGVLSKYILC